MNPHQAIYFVIGVLIGLALCPCMVFIGGKNERRDDSDSCGGSGTKQSRDERGA